MSSRRLKKSASRGWDDPVSSLCSRNARPQKALVGRAQGGLIRAIRGQGKRASLEGRFLLFACCSLALDKARPRVKRLSWQTQGGRVNYLPGLGG
jgi:hypothetical protein